MHACMHAKLRTLFLKKKTGMEMQFVEYVVEQQWSTWSRAALVWYPAHIF